MVEMARVRKKTIGRREHNKIVSMKGSSSFSSSEEEDFELRNLLLDGNQCLYENAEISNKKKVISVIPIFILL
eukprot:jgi/Bigna1/137373/aug1.39_g12081